MNYRKSVSRAAWSVVPALLVAAACTSSGCLAPPVAQVAATQGASKRKGEDASKAPTAFYSPTWMDASGREGKGGTWIATSEGDKRTVPLREDGLPPKVKGDSSIKKHPNWMLFHSALNGGKTLAFEFKWVTTKEDKFYGNMWAGFGVAFNPSWSDTDISAAKYLVMYVKASREDLDNAEFTVKIASKDAAKGQEQTARIPLKTYAEGKKIGTDWTKVVIPIKAFTDLAQVDITRTHTINFDIAGKWPENELVWYRIDNVYFSDAELLTPVENVGYAVAKDGVEILWDKSAGEKFDKFVVSVDGKEAATVDGNKRSAKLPLATFPANTEHKVTVIAANARESSSPQSVKVKVSGAAPETATVSVDPKPLHEISPLIFGSNFLSADSKPLSNAASVKDLGATVQRWGGNITSMYNYKADNDNKGKDWFYLDDFSKPAGTPETEKQYYKFIRDGLATGAQINFTIPIGDWIAKPHPSPTGRYCSYPTSIYPQQDKTDGQGCGNGFKPGGKEIIWGNDPNVALVPNSVEFQRGLVENIKKSFGGAGNKGVRYYSLDNEPGLWHETHRDAMPKGLSTDDLIERNIKYATMIKEVDPDAKVIGLSAWGMLELAGSNVDYMPTGPDGYKNYDHPAPADKYRDRKKHGDQPQLVSYLKAMQAAEKKAGKRLIDIVDFHWYPEVYGNDSKGDRQRLSEEHAADPVLLPKQLDAVREWYDPTFKPEWSWANDAERAKYLWEPFHPVIPAIKKMVEDAYPGTKIAINEYDTGSHNYYHGAVIRAAVLGVFMQEDLYMGQNWHQGDVSQPAYWGQKLYGNYDNKGSKIRGRFLKSTSSHKDLWSFAVDNNGKTQVVLVNRNLTSPLVTTVKLPKAARTYQTYTFSDGGGQRLIESPIQQVNGQDVSVQVPALAFTLVVAQ